MCDEAAVWRGRALFSSIIAFEPTMRNLAYQLFEADMTFHAKVSPSGRISLPAALRKRLGLARGGSVMIEETEDGLLILTRAQAIEQAQRWSRELIGDKPGFSVDDFIAEKRREAARDEE